MTQFSNSQEKNEDPQPLEPVEEMIVDGGVIVKKKGVVIRESPIQQLIQQTPENVGQEKDHTVIQMPRQHSMNKPVNHEVPVYHDGRRHPEDDCIACCLCCCLAECILACFIGDGRY